MIVELDTEATWIDAEGWSLNVQRGPVTGSTVEYMWFFTQGEDLYEGHGLIGPVASPATVALQVLVCALINDAADHMNGRPIVSHPDICEAVAAYVGGFLLAKASLREATGLG